MTSPLFSTAYLPSVLFMAVLTQYDAIAIEQKETFPKQTFRNRTAIATAGGVQLLNVPVVRPEGNHSRTEQMLLTYQEPWNVRHWRAIVSAYSAAPYFLYYRDGIEQILLQQHNRLIDLNDALLRYLLKKLKINCQISYTEDFAPPASVTPDYRSTLTDKHTLEPTSPFNSSFLSHPYPQVFDTRYAFQPNLSVIDLLFNTGPEAKATLSAIGKELFI